MNEFEKSDKLQLWMPILKEYKGEYVAILSDTSLDRDNELMSKGVLEEFSKGDYLPGLINHDNKVENLVCEWVNRRVIEKDGHNALIANPRFYKSNPKAVMIMDMLEKDGARLGVSISAIPLKSEMVEVNGKSYKQYTEVEKVEASFIPIQSNRSAVAMSIAKSFDINVPEIVTKPASVERCVEALKNDPKFKPKDGKTKEESAWAVCQAAHDKGFETVKEFIETDDGYQVFYKYFEKEVENKMDEKELVALKESNDKLLKELNQLKEEMSKKTVEKEMKEEPKKEAKDETETEEESKVEEESTEKKVEEKKFVAKKELEIESKEETPTWSLNEAISKAYGLKKR